MSAKKPKRNTQKSVVVNDEASAALQKLCTQQERSLQHMESTLRGIGDALDVLRARVRQARALVWGLPEDIRAEDLPQGCPGWGNYATDLMTCGLCRFNLECMTVQDEREMQSRDLKIAAEVVKKYFRGA